MERIIYDIENICFDWNGYLSIKIEFFLLILFLLLLEFVVFIVSLKVSFIK